MELIFDEFLREVGLTKKQYYALPMLARNRIDQAFLAWLRKKGR